MYTEGSVEDHRYVSRLSRERRAFEELIRAKEGMVISLPDHTVCINMLSNSVLVLLLYAVPVCF